MTLSTRGHSLKFMGYIQIPSSHHSGHYSTWTCSNCDRQFHNPESYSVNFDLKKEPVPPLLHETFQDCDTCVVMRVLDE